MVRMCSQDLKPFSIVEGQGFIEVAKELINIGAKYGSSAEVEDVLPSARTVSRHVEDEYKKVKKHVIDELKQCPDWAVTTDLWAEERTNTHYITVTVHYILGWKLLNRVLASREIMGEFGILSKDVVVVTDNGSNVVAAFKDYTRLSCAGHTINLILKYTFDHLDVENPLHSPVINLFRDVKTLVTHFKRAGLQKALDRSLKQAVETRWNTILAMLQSVRDALRSDPDLLEDIIRLLEPFDEATRHLSTDQTPSLHLVFPTKATLLRGLLLQDGDSVIVKELKGILGQAVELKFKINLYHKIATALSPSLRCFLRKTLNAEEYEEVINTLAAITERVGIVARTSVQQEDPPHLVATGTEVHSFFSSCVQEEEWEDLGNTYESWSRKLVLKYMNEPTKMTGQSLLNFWQEMSGELVPVARKLLAIPATSTPSERSFSVAGRLIEERRTSLSPECVDTLLLLHSNKEGEQIREVVAVEEDPPVPEGHRKVQAQKDQSGGGPPVV
ncbi:unnamed protein product [Leuciscus chuanchicus]